MNKKIALLSLFFASLCLPLQATVDSPEVVTEQTAEPITPVITAAAKPKLTWCLDHFPYFHDYDATTTPTGPSVELMQELARRVGFELNFTPRTNLARCLKLMEQGKVDLMTNLKFSEQRNQFMVLLPYSNNIAESLFLRLNDERLIQSQAQLRGLTLATLRHFLYNPATMVLIAEESRHIAQVDSIEIGLEMLLRNRIDGLVAPTISTTEAINAASSYQHRFKIAPIDFSGTAPNNIHLAIARNSQNKALIPLLQQHLQAMIDDGTVARLIRSPENRTDVKELKQ
ncbi:substrate-binding periplasmic protein [Arsukibacterium sp. UBA3155]|uniref:substrate-binding periplasmic protein n=1 Tax=Arsukibacterium sp. UBA3155 TaxID=1946058 RepID=UPI0025B8F50D|nr:transporter substrate-binding domain-containing protein [Arsukibacterium sp. UBA3155]|tara:strand:+ start:17678 stop:18535 length:858 start_codon:yes stop_codon:yes gene_type:complete